MKYGKPELVSLGPATALIQGEKRVGSESTAPMTQLTAADSELDD
jgi:hypothetical protein